MKTFTYLQYEDCHQKLGNGTFGYSKLCKSKKNQEKYVIKVLFTNQADDFAPRYTERISKLVHPCICHICSYNTFNHDINLLLPYFENGNLTSAIQADIKHKPPKWWDTTCKMKAMYGIAVGMAYLHSENVFHRNLTTNNILFDNNYEIKISDIGCVQLFDYKDIPHNNFTLSRCFTTAPEILTGRYFDDKSDVYSFSYILYEIICRESFIKFIRQSPSSLPIEEIVHKNRRPQINPRDFPYDNQYLQLMEQCWDAEASFRPSFSEIADFFKENPIRGTNLDQFRMYVQKVDIKFDVKPKFQTILPTPVKLEINSPPKYNFRFSSPVAEIKTEVIDLDIEEIDDGDDGLFGLDEMDSLTQNKSGNSIPQLKPNTESDGFDTFPHFSPPHEQSDLDDAEKSTQINNSPQPTESINQLEKEMTNSNQFENETSNANQEQTETNIINQPEKEKEKEIESEINSSTSANQEIPPKKKKKKKEMYMKTKRASVEKPLIFKDRHTTTQEIKKRADQGDPFAMYQYGISMYHPGIDPGIPEIYHAAMKKQPDAMYWLAIHYLNSLDGFTCDLRRAYKFLRSAAHRKHLLAQFSFGFYMENGVRIKPMRKSITGELIADKNGFVWPIDLRRGFKYLKKAANKNHPMAAYLIARKYETGIDTIYQISNLHDKAGVLVDNIRFVVPKDDALCTKYYRVAAINGNLPSMIKYAERANKGIGMDPDYIESAFFLKKASLSDDQVALYNYGVHLYKGTAGLTSNFADSLENLLKSAKKGYQPAAKFLLEIIKSHPDEIEAIQNDIPNLKKLAE